MRFNYLLVDLIYVTKYQVKILLFSEQYIILTLTINDKIINSEFTIILYIITKLVRYN